MVAGGPAGGWLLIRGMARASLNNGGVYLDVLWAELGQVRQVDLCIHVGGQHRHGGMLAITWWLTQSRPRLWCQTCRPARAGPRSAWPSAAAAADAAAVQPSLA